LVYKFGTVVERGGREDGRDYLTALLLLQVVGDQEWEEDEEEGQGVP
jgi:hypothetical protein